MLIKDIIGVLRGWHIAYEICHSAIGVAWRLLSNGTAAVPAAVAAT
jgi:hypothetical protein